MPYDKPDGIDHDKAVTSLEPLAKDLLPGERLMVTTLAVCGCMIGYIPPMVGAHHSCCHICNGTGWIRDVKTWVGEKP